MSVTLAKPGDDQPASDTFDYIAPAHVFITVAQLPDGRVSGVDLYANAPTPDEVLPATVWTVSVPDVDDMDPSAASKVLDLALTSDYRDTDGHGWSEAERKNRAFHQDETGERAFLRTVEALLIRAGYFNAHTGLVQCQGYGLRVGDDDVVMKWAEGWKWAALDSTDIDGWCLQPGVLAPADASPQRVANAIILNLACLDLDLYERLPLHHRARVYVRTFGWRARLHRIAYRLTRFRRTVRARATR
ncbi:hypothetical protein ACFUC2_05035 [[Kitasatospora] papulosa]|uniref:hypothetical protein n=1 Tax=[Kitasatospora] papulosa TaxID=1464011 RepID=UPI0036270D32